MEGGSLSAYSGVKGYWKRKKYERLNGPRPRRRKLMVVELGGGPGSNHIGRRFLKVRITPKQRFSPKKLFDGICNAYVNFMVRIAYSSPMIGVGGFDASFVGFENAPPKEYEEKVITQIYKDPLLEYDDKMIGQIYRSLVAAKGQLVPRGAARTRSRFACGKR
ncbi:hypothetical protein Vadar_025408 [Vaccinium darrowii]|uniref:Uncharacterized protein n=1 Tax=Vaccinium darrowii TaxID=229202 RepID=A0ACB7XCP9_9ERIC|nr:hypothetical protein Vadar_025408 [Vaccinium darrowii]